MAEIRETQCCIAGGGPAGAMLGLLLARQGLDVVVLEKHRDFLRDFRGDTIHPSTMEILDELGLADAFLALGPNRVTELRGRTPAGELKLADFSRLPSRFPFIAMIPQWDFLDFLTGEAARYPGFHLLMSTQAVDLVVEDGVVRGVRCRAPGGEVEVRATLTVAADGRHSVLRARAGLPRVSASMPIDVLWFRLPRRATDTDQTGGSVGDGHLLAQINRGEYWQCAYTIPKGGAEALRAAGIEAFRQAIGRAASALADRVDTLRGWDQVSLLSVRADRLRRWHRPGLLCIGDAAHAMSPVGGVGINFAIQDAVEAANLLAGPLRRGRVEERDLARVQRRRAWQVRVVQPFQARMMATALAASRPRRGALSRLAAPLRAVGGWLATSGLARRLVGRLIALGVRRTHVRLPETAFPPTLPSPSRGEG